MRIGVDLGGTKIEAIAMDPQGNVLGRERKPTPVGSYVDTLRAVSDLVFRFESQFLTPATVGVGIPGAISARSEVVKNANSTCLIGHPIHKDLAQMLDREVRIENDANCFALSEATDGAGAGAQSVFGAILGTGVGGGFVVHGRLLRGPNAIAGEWGHNPLPWMNPEERPGPACYCGKRGCIECFVSGPGLSATFRRLGGGDAMAEEVVVLAEEGNELATVCVMQYENQLARALAHVINIMDPEVIVLGGGMSNVSRLYRTVPALWGRFVFSDTVETRLFPPEHGDSSGVRGAAWLWPTR